MKKANLLGLALLATAGYPLAAVSAAQDRPAAVGNPDKRNADALEAACSAGPPRAAGLVDIAPDGTGTTAHERDCVILSGNRLAAQIARAIEVSDGASGPPSAPGIATAASASYALSLVNVRPEWATSGLVGEADGLSVFVRQATGDTAAFLANVGVRSGFAATVESLTFAADPGGLPVRAVRTQLGVVNSRDGGEYGLVLQAAEGKELSAGLRIASVNDANWTNFIEAVSPAGETLALIRGRDGAIMAGDILPTSDRQRSVGSAEARYSAMHTEIVQLAGTPFAALPRCGDGEGGGMLARVSDARQPAMAWGQPVDRGGGTYQVFVKCDGERWAAF